MVNKRFDLFNKISYTWLMLKFKAQFNHDEVNKQLSEIKEILIKIVNQQKPL